IKSNLNFEETYEAITRMKISQLEKYSSIFLENLMTQYTHDPEFFDNDAINAQMEIYNELFEKGQSEGKIDSNLTKEDFMLDRKSTRLNSSHVSISYAVFCLKKKIQT